MKIARQRLLDEVQTRLREFPVVALIGMRQSGKTTLAKDIVATQTGQTHFLDLEDARQLARLREPIAALEPLRGLIVLDEVQHLPDVFSALRVLADRPGKPARFLVLGSASGELLGQSAESLAGRIAYVEVPGLGLDEIGPSRLERLWLRGGLPASLLARNDAASTRWRENYVRTFLERDVPQLGIGIPAATLRRFWTMLAHWHGQIWNGSAFGSSFGVSHTSVRHYLDALTDALVVTTLQPWTENIAKRQVKAPKVFLTDSGILHTLLQLHTHDDLMCHPRVGASWEGLMLSQAVRRLGAAPEERFFWATHAGAELDLLAIRGRQRIGVECKLTSVPAPTASMRVAVADLKLDHLYVLHAGKDTFPLGERLTAVAAARLLEDLPRLR
ncbi:MAG: ATP-binding protein [Planctomycetes bacterium]|nr:ATP-binding protein [Planctomycetota bacterium]